jgi:drug/metabolite transporter (DMT)-like permease
VPTVILCTVYMCIGPSLILLNKYILHNLHFPYPMFLSGLGVLVSGIVAQVLVRTGYVTLQRKEAVEGILWYKRVLPVGLAHASTLAFGNTVYLYLPVGFIQMLKSFTPVVMMIVSYIASIDTPTKPVILSIVIIAFGTATTCSFTPVLNIVGIAIMFAAETAEAIRLVLTQFFLQNLKFGVVEGQYVLAPASAFWLFLASFVYEFDSMRKTGAFSVVASNPLLFLAASSMGLAVNFLSYLVIQSTSSLTMKVLGTLRNILTIFLGVLFYNETVEANEWLGYMVALVGFVVYNIAKSGYWDSSSVLPLSRKHSPGNLSSSSDDVADGGEKNSTNLISTSQMNIVLEMGPKQTPKQG